MERNHRQLVIAVLVFLIVALGSVVGFVSCGWRLPSESDDPTVRGPLRPTDVVVTVGSIRPVVEAGGGGPHPGRRCPGHGAGVPWRRPVGEEDGATTTARRRGQRSVPAPPA